MAVPTARNNAHLRCLIHPEAGNLSVKHNEISAMLSIVEHGYSDTLALLAELF